MKYTIKTYTGGSKKTPPDRLRFYILSKGLHSGRPSKSPNYNSFEITAASEEESKMLFSVAYALWKCKGPAYLLKGSVIPFIRIKEYRKLLKKYLEAVSFEDVSGFIEAVNLTEKGIESAEKKIKLLNEIQAALSKKMLRKSLKYQSYATRF